MVLLLLFPAICWVALRLLRLIHVNKEFPDKNQKSLSKLGERHLHTHTHTQSKAVLKITELNHTYGLLKMMLLEAMKASDAILPMQSWSAKCSSYLHTPSGRKPSRPGRLQGDKG